MARKTDHDMSCPPDAGVGNCQMNLPRRSQSKRGRLRLGLLGICSALLLACSTPEGNAAPRPSTTTMPGGEAGPRPKERIPYGSDPLQFGDLRVPSRAGPFPVAVVIHGGCWANQYGLDLMDS